MNEEYLPHDDGEDVLDVLYDLLSEEDGRAVYLNNNIFLDLHGDLIDAPYNRV